MQTTEPFCFSASGRHRPKRSLGAPHRESNKRCPSHEGVARRNACGPLRPSTISFKPRLMTESESIRGTCVCGEVHYAVRPPFRFFQYCHCSRCRKRSGSIHAANLAVPLDQLTFTAGEHLVQTFELATASHWGNAFCQRCGSGLPWKSRNGRGWIVPAGSLDDTPPTKPTRNIHYASRATWHVDAASLETFDEGVPPAPEVKK